MHVTILTSAGLATGGARQAIYLGRGLKEAGHTVRFVAPPGSEVLRLAGFLDPLELPSTLRATESLLSSLIPRDEPMVLHGFHNRGVKLTAYIGTWWRVAGKRAVCAAHRGVTARPNNPLPYLLPGIRAYIVNSKATADMLPLLWRRKRCYLVNNSIPEERLAVTRDAGAVRAELGIPEGHIILGDVAHDKPEKAVDRLIMAYAKAKGQLPPSTLVVVGVNKAKWEGLCAELGITDDVRLVPRTEHVADYVQFFSLFVFPSYFIESQPNVLMEAMSLGVPVIGSDIGGVPDMLRNEFLFKPGDVDECAAKMIEVASNSELLKAMSAENAAKKDEFSTAYRVKRVVEIYESILKEAGLA